MSENWSLAFEHATGTYVTFLGADESVVSRELETYLEELEDRAGVFHFAAPAFFRWPGLHSPFGLVSLKMSWRFPVVLREASLDYLSGLNQNSLTPNPYCRGSIRRECLPKFSLTNPIPGPAPDFVLAHLTSIVSSGTRLTVSDSIPFVVGTSKESTGLSWGKEGRAEWLKRELGEFDIQSLDSDYRSSYLLACKLLGEEPAKVPSRNEEWAMNTLPKVYLRFPVGPTANSITVVRMLGVIIRLVRLLSRRKNRDKDLAPQHSSL
jgi:hypothetical protein